MRVLLCPDKFRGSLTAQEVCAAMTEGIRLVSHDIHVIAQPMADGGEGTLDVLLDYSKGTRVKVSVQDPLGRPTVAAYGLSGDGLTAFVEMASASGLHLLHVGERKPLETSTFGTGQLIAHALSQGVKRIILGIGGSATTDAGTGMAAALGWLFLDDQQQRISPSGGNLTKICSIIPPSRVFDAEVVVACDVQNPLFGPEGAAQVYAPQKGASAADVAQLDAGLRHFAALTDPHRQGANQAGAGAAGGLGYGAMFFLNATLQEGVNLLMEETNFEQQLTDVQLILTGEGKIDHQTLQGKLIAGITHLAQGKRIPVAALCGTLSLEPSEWEGMGLCYAASIINRPMPLSEALTYGYEGVRDATFSLINLLYKQYFYRL